MKILKLFSLILFSALAFNAYGMEEGIVLQENEQETDSPVPSLRDLCIKRVAELIKQDPELCEKKGQPQLTHDIEKQVACELMKDHPIIPLILEELEVTSSKIFYDTRSGVFSPDGSQTLSVPLNQTAKRWNKETERLIHRLPTDTGCMVNSATFSPDGSLTLTASGTNTAKLWDSQTVACLHTFTGPIGRILPLQDDYIISATFSPDGSEILIVSCSKTAKLWKIANIIRVKNILNNHLSISQAILLNKINQDTTNGKKSILNEYSAEVFNSLDPEIQKALCEYVSKKPVAATVPCTII